MDAALAGRAALAGDAPSWEAERDVSLFKKKIQFTIKWNEMNFLSCNIAVVASFLTSAVFAFVEDLDDT